MTTSQLPDHAPADPTPRAAGTVAATAAPTLAIASEAATPPQPPAGPGTRVDTDTRGPIRLGFWSLIVGFGLFVLWAALAPLDEGAPATGVVAVEGNRTLIQHLQGGVIARLNVREGQEVEAGQVLLELDPAATRASFETVRQNYLAQRALEGRLLAELANEASVSFHPDLDPADTAAAQHMAVQRQLFAARRGARQADINALQQVIAGTEAQLAGVAQVIQSRSAQRSLQATQLAGVRELAAEGFAPRNQALQLEQVQAELTASLTELANARERLDSALAEARLRLSQRRQEYIKEVSTELAAVRREVQANQERLSAITAELGRTQIRAPVAGQVIGLSVRGPGGVVQAGQPLMDILPRGQHTLLDLRVPTNLIDRVRVGQEVEVRLHAFAHTPTMVVLGRMTSLAGDAVTDPQSRQSYYIARAEITPEGLAALEGRRIQPGMTADALIKTGERSLLTYLLQPLTRRIAQSMTEL